VEVEVEVKVEETGEVMGKVRVVEGELVVVVEREVLDQDLTHQDRGQVDQRALQALLRPPPRRRL
jgi:hypothetical protein